MSLLKKPSHPGEVLFELYLQPLGMKAPTLARHLCVPRTRVERLVTSLISFERNRYSVSASFANRSVSLQAYPDRLVVAAEGNALCEHVRVIQRNHKLLPRTIYDWRHNLAVVQRKPKARRNDARSWNCRLPSDSYRITWLAPARR